MITGRASLVSWTVGAVEASFAAAELSDGRLAEILALGAGELDGQDRGGARRVGRRGHAGDHGGLREFHHHPGTAGREKAIAIGGDQPFLAASGLGRQVEGNLGKVDDDPVRALHDGDLRRHRLRQSHLEACLPAIRLDRYGRGDGGRSGLCRLRLAQAALAACSHDDGHEAGADEAYDEGCKASQIAGGSSVLPIPINGAWLTELSRRRPVY